MCYLKIQFSYLQLLVTITFMNILILLVGKQILIEFHCIGKENKKSTINIP